MPDKVSFFVIGLIVGFMSFAAVGALTSLLMDEAQQQMTAQVQPVPTSYAQITSGANRIVR